MAPGGFNAVGHIRCQFGHADQGGGRIQLAVWTDGRPLALPRADFVAFRRAEETLAMVPFHEVLEQLGDLIEEKPGYPPRYLTRSFPDDWQLDPLRNQPEE